MKTILSPHFKTGIQTLRKLHVSWERGKGADRDKGGVIRLGRGWSHVAQQLSLQGLSHIRALVITHTLAHAASPCCSQSAGTPFIKVVYFDKQVPLKSLYATPCTYTHSHCILSNLLYIYIWVVLSSPYAAFKFCLKCNICKLMTQYEFCLYFIVIFCFSHSSYIT